MDDKQLSIQQAYNAMYAFLAEHYEALKGDEIGALLGSMSLMEDNRPFDQALWDTWQRCVDKSLTDEVDSFLRLK